MHYKLVSFKCCDVQLKSDQWYRQEIAQTINCLWALDYAKELDNSVQ